MGKIGSEAEPSVNHFSHPHPLQLCDYQPQQTLNLASCSGCKLNVSGFIYTCPTCNYFLHIKCSQMPQQITHPFHQHHIFSLLPKPIYPDGLFNCDACGNEGNGFSYHCKACNFDLHILCASMPLSLSHQSHHHPLSLTFSPPYPTKSFSCDICKSTGTNHWLYRCNFCEFDAHLNCATVQSNQPPMGQSQTSRFAPQSSVPNFMNHSGYGLVRPVGMRQSNDIFNQAIQSVLNGGSQSAGQNLLQGILGGGGGGGGGRGQNLLHALMGSGGGGQNLMQGLTGGGGGLNVLQTLMGGGGGGGVGTPNLLQAFMGGGGTGGVDVFEGSGGGGDGASFPILDSLNGLSGGFQDFSL